MILQASRETAAVIPAFNEAATISNVVEKVSAYATAIVVDDGSTDGTAGCASCHGAVVVSHSENRGYEAALLSGMEKAIELGARFVITLDADGQHDPDLIARFRGKLSEDYDLVVGVRDRKQRVGEKVFAVVGNLLWGMQDPLCGMKAYKVSALYGLHRLEGFDSVGTKFAINAVREGARLAQIAISTTPRCESTSRFGAGLKPNIRIISALLKTIMFIHMKR